MTSSHQEGADFKIASMIKTRTQFGARDMGPSLRVCIPLLEDLSLDPNIHAGCLQLPVILILEDPTSS